MSAALAEQFSTEQIKSPCICTTFALGTDSLHGIKLFLADDRFMGIGRDDLPLRWDSNILFGFAVDDFCLQAYQRACIYGIGIHIVAYDLAAGGGDLAICIDKSAELGVVIAGL